MANRDKGNDSGQEVSFDQRFKNTLLSGDFTEGWALLSTSGMENAGQTMVYAYTNKEAVYVEFAGKNSKVINQRGDVSGKSLGKFSTAVKNDDLPDYLKSFDGIHYTYLHLQKANGKLEETRKIEFANPSISKGSAKHYEIVQAFEQIVNSL